MRRRAQHEGGRASALLLSLACILPLLLAAPVAAQAAPTRDMPVGVTVQQIDPRTVVPGSTVTVTGTVTNFGSAAISDLVLRLQSGRVLTSRDELRRNDEDPSSANTGFGEFVDLPGVLAPGETAPFRYQTTAAELALADLGVYPVLVNVNGTPEGDVEQRVGQVETYLPFFPEPVLAPTAVSWLWPLIDRPHRGPAGAFVDDELAASLAGGGRLDRLLSIAEDNSALPLTLVVDPLLLEDVQVMSGPGGYQLSDGSAGRGGAAAGAWLDRLRALAADHPVLALPYADLDTVALARAGLDAEAGTSLTEGRALAADILGVPPRAALAWPVSGVLTEQALQLLRDSGVSEVVLAGSASERDPAAEGLGRTPSAPALLGTESGQLTALVTDPMLDAIVGQAEQFPAGPRLAEQRYLAELAMITAEAPAAGRQLLIAPPRRWEPTSYAAAMLSDTATLPWLAAGNATTLADPGRGTPPVDRGQLVYPDAASAQELAGTGMQRLLAAVAARADFSSMLLTTTAPERQIVDRLTAPARRAVWRGASSYWRGNPTGFAAAAADAGTAIEALREQVFLVVPADGTYSLASATASLVFTVENQLPVAVQVGIRIDASAAAGLSTDDVGRQTIGAGARTLIEVPARVERSGEFRVTAAIATPAGDTLGGPVQLRVRSTAYGVIALIITLAAGALLVLLITLRLVRRLRAGRDRRRGGPPTPLEQRPLPEPARR